MRKSNRLLLPLLIFATLFCAGPVWGEGKKSVVPADGLIFGTKQQSGFKTTSNQVKADLSNAGLSTSLHVQVEHGTDGFPGVDFIPADGSVWDLSQYGGVDAVLTNTGTRDQSICMRIDNAGDWQTNPWNAENLYLRPGEKGTARVTFGTSYGKAGFKLRSNAIVGIKLFTGNPVDAQSFRLDSITAVGKPGVRIPPKSEDIRLTPDGGRLLADGIKITAGQLEFTDAAATSDGSKLKLEFPAGKVGEVSFKPAAGKWDLREYLQLTIAVRNIGKSPVVVKARAETSPAGASDWATTGAPIAPGGKGAIVVPFIASKSWATEVGGNALANDAVSLIRWTVEPTAEAALLAVDSIVAGMPVQVLPEWLGKRPPVDGEWIQTFEENFDGKTLDATKWNVKTVNYWDPQSHFSKDNVLVNEGAARLRFEDKVGFHNDDPAEKKTDYATGFLDTYDKFAQRYGYFEARMKLPKSPGLWPAFWLMPDRGRAAGETWNRSNTENGGMEFDILEYLSRWGPCRYNIAMHWDGYEKNHKSTGSQLTYAQPDKDGYITAGLLWLPGQAIYYANGREVLRWENPRVSNVPSYIMFTHVSGGWDNDPLDDAKLPADFVIDYTRVWQRKDLLVGGAK